MIDKLNQIKLKILSNRNMVDSTGGGTELRQVFADYCAGQGTMDGKSFAKMCKDTKLIDKKMTATDVDLIFAKSKAKTDRRITFD